ncbi:hypothetical protein [Azospirillum argentinense]|uniref:hypothetical protein n=1 Tax=Azospirillum argentinense TaxID=2970906 RepID=UPI0010C0BF92|nr:hypothetical protein [Azospirillum argentinense]
MEPLCVRYGVTLDWIYREDERLMPVGIIEGIKAQLRTLVDAEGKPLKRKPGRPKKNKAPYRMTRRRNNRAWNGKRFARPRGWRDQGAIRWTAMARLWSGWRSWSNGRATTRWAIPRRGRPGWSSPAPIWRGSC